MNTRKNPLNAYKEINIRTAGQGRLIVMLYDEALKQIDIAIRHLEGNSKKLDIVNASILKTQNIITELIASLDFEKGGEIAGNLFTLYMYFNSQLMDANFRKVPEPLAAVRPFLADLRDAWSTIAAKNQADGNVPERNGINVAG